MGSEVWETTRLTLPPALAGRRWRNLFTGEMLTVEDQDGASALSLAAVLGAFPVALLECCPVETPAT
jgi:maltooligosyltrehalose synthase